jgi:arylsulfatase A-like enzyme
MLAAAAALAALLVAVAVFAAPGPAGTERPAAYSTSAARTPTRAGFFLADWLERATSALRSLFGDAGDGALRPNIILILTDDQRWDSLDATHTPDGSDAMPNVRARLEASGLTFRNAFLTTPLCCPSRASILTGQYASHHGVRTNDKPYGGVAAFDDTHTLATALRAAGYRTALIGKYMNRYETLALADGHYYVPPGWDTWQAFVLPDYFRYTLVENGETVRYGSDDSDYSTDVLRDKAVSFIDRCAGERKPFFLFLNPRAPHLAAVPAPRHRGRFAELRPWRPPSYDEADVSDKPWFVRKRPLLATWGDKRLDKQRIDMLESMLAVDEAVAAIMDTLERLEIADDTLVVYASDNGFMWGEHRLDKKRCPYEECIRTPLIMRYPRLIPQARTEDAFAANIDFMPTFVELAGASTPLDMDGRSLLPLIEGRDPEPPRDVLIEGWQTGYVFAGVRAQRWKYVEYLSGEIELYDLLRDPYELVNVAADPGHAPQRRRFARRLHELRPRWPGDAREIARVLTHDAPD